MKRRFISSAKMLTKAQIVVFSHLSDAQIKSTTHFPAETNVWNATEHINFAKYVISHCNGDLTQKIDADELYKKFVLETNK